MLLIKLIQLNLAQSTSCCGICIRGILIRCRSNWSKNVPIYLVKMMLWCHDLSFILLYSVSRNKLLIKRDFPRSSLPSLLLTKSSLPGDDSITVFLSVCVCVSSMVYVCVRVNTSACLRDKGALSSAQWEKQRPWLRTLRFFFFLRLTDGGQIESISYVYFQDTAVTDIKGGMRQDKEAVAGKGEER